MAPSFDLQRFLDAQNGVITDVRRELANGRKLTHWMWFVFPQLAGLGRSAMAQFYAIDSLGEADAYLRHPVLGARLLECAGLVLATRERTASDIFGTPDDMKFHSSMTLFSSVPDTSSCFQAALDRFFVGAPDPATLRLLGA